MIYYKSYKDNWDYFDHEVPAIEIFMNNDLIQTSTY